MTKRTVILLIFIVLSFSGCVNPDTSSPLEMVTPVSTLYDFFYGTGHSVSYKDILPIVDEGIETFGGDPLLYRDVVSQCLFEIEERSSDNFTLTRIDDKILFYIEDPQKYSNRYREIVVRVINDVMSKVYTNTYTPLLTEDKDSATFIISFVPYSTYMGLVFSSGGIYGLYMITEEEESVIKRGFIYIRDYDFLKSTHPSFSDNEIWTIIEAVLSEEMAQAPINGQDTSLDPTMRFYNSPKIDDYLRYPHLTKKDYEIIKIALGLPPGVDKGQWIKFMDQYMKGGE